MHSPAAFPPVDSRLSRVAVVRPRSPPAVSVCFMQPTGRWHPLVGIDACAVKQALLLTGGNLLFPDHVPRTALNRFSLHSRVLLVTQGRLCTMLAQRLLCVQGQRDLLQHALIHATSILSRRHIFNYSAVTCVATLEGHSRQVTSVVFHPTAPLLATGSENSTVKLWRLYSNNSSATCVATLEGHNYSVFSVAFHPTAPLLATGSHDPAMKLWRLSSDYSSATCVAILEGHSCGVNSIAFHPRAPILATGSHDSTVKLWRLKPDHSSATCVATL